MKDDLIIQQPLDKISADTELLLLFHGVGSSADDLRLLGQALAEHRPAAWVISVRAPEPSDFGQGWQWFSVRGVSEVNRPARVASALTAFRCHRPAHRSHLMIGTMEPPCDRHIEATP